MKSIILSISLLFSFSSLWAQTGKTEKEITKPASSSEQDYKLEQWLKESKIPTLGLGVIRNGKLEKAKVYGDYQKGIPSPDNTRFNVASLTKPVTAMVALKLASQGQWDIDEPLYHYWTDPDIAEDARNKKLTTRIVLSHQTGFPNWRILNPNGKLGFQFDPGTKYQYSGEGFEYLKRALENKFHQPLSQLGEELIFKPLKMKDTSYIWGPNTDPSRIATGYDKDGKPYDPVKRETASGADDLMTTVSDYGHFLISVMNGEGLSKKIFAEMQTGQVASEKGKYFGLGFEIYNLGNGNIALSHGGSDDGVRTLFVIIPKTKQGLVILTNTDEGAKAYEKLIIDYLGEEGKRIVDIEMK
ncbi:serine hydrolase domain-containing protein [Chryseobacterium indologenes]|uniref:serine hydrolase domain-containing protein n=1 Tax=Chryseobacterium indologenes TaxID=253 RepID=UPI001626BAD2|nr:serine hydrolase domain-containing protein [Chryseobacterium indologenes]